MNNIPVGYDYVNTYNSYRQPSTFHPSENAYAAYFRKYLMHKAISLFKWKIPKQWNKNYFIYSLFELGHVAIIDTAKFGVIPQFSGLSGYGVFYQPTRALISNPHIPGIKEYDIGRNCEIIYLNPDYTGISDIVDHYADMMAVTVQSIFMNLNQTKNASFFFTESKSGAETMKKAFDKMQSGDLMVVIDKQLFNNDGSPNWVFFNPDVGKNYIVDKLRADLRGIEQAFDTEIGIPNANTEKKERLISDEVNANNYETMANALVWLENLQECCERVNDMFPDINISVEMRKELNYESDTLDNGVI